MLLTQPATARSSIRRGGPGSQRSGAAITGMYAHRCSARGKAFNSCESLGLGYGCHTSWITYHPAFMLCVPMARSQVPFLRYMLSTIFCRGRLAQIGSLASFPLRLMPSPAKSKGIYIYISVAHDLGQGIIVCMYVCIYMCAAAIAAATATAC